MSYSIDLSKQSVLPMEDAERCLISSDPANASDYGPKRRDVSRTTAWMNDCTSPHTVILRRGTYIYRGKKIAYSEVFWGYFEILEFLWNEFRNDREKIANAMRANGMSHVPYLQGVARGFAVPKRQCYKLPDGWLVESGIGIERARKLLYSAAISVGLTPGPDLIVCVRSGKLET
jgi:hypothetical protein